MASVLRNEHRLRTIRIRLKPSREEVHLEFKAYLGDELLDGCEVFASDIGIPPEQTVPAYRNARFTLPKVVSRMLEKALVPLSSGPEDPIWLQLGRSSGQLAVVPWERLFQPSFDAPILRIPNFLSDPTFLTGPLRLVLCASAPRAKGSFGVGAYIREVEHLVRTSIAHGTEIHIFTDEDAFQDLRYSDAANTAQHTTILHDPNTSSIFGRGSVDRELSTAAGRLVSPWLLWMQRELSGVPVDAVHFICPGFFRRDRGALALAHSPLLNIDRKWSHFVGSEELIAFLDIVGAWATGFSSPHEDVWAMGLRLLADQLAWNRVGPLFIHDTASEDSGALASTYKFLFGQEFVDPPRAGSISLYTHPKRLKQFSEKHATFSAAQPIGFAIESEFGSSVDLSSFVNRPSREASAESAKLEKQWEKSGMAIMDNMMLRAQDLTPDARKGVLDAVGMLTRMMKSEGKL